MRDMCSEDASDVAAVAVEHGSASLDSALRPFLNSFEA